ncbi:hypothetical protein V1517DRAFT_306081 [Lipomyces orientalis]|uniref:Uncharacterized protein n=1 Tax=Lipomyces orientalis TaxID=1233043 RepID=A0ACC3TTA1_9ASCO
MRLRGFKHSLFSSLPAEVVTSILSYIDEYDDLLALSLTCKCAILYYEEEHIYKMKVYQFLRSKKMGFYAEYKDRLSVKTWKEGYGNLIRNMQLYEILSFCMPLETGGNSLVASHN